MPQVGFESTTPVFAEAKTVYALDRTGTVIGLTLITKKKLRGPSPPTNYTDRATAVCRRS
jgi:hypothetical protein